MNTSDLLRYINEGWPTPQEWAKLSLEDQWILMNAGLMERGGALHDGVGWEWLKPGPMDSPYPSPTQRGMVGGMGSPWPDYTASGFGPRLTKEEAERILARSAELYPRPKPTKRQIREFIADVRRLHGVKITEEKAIYELSRRGFKPLSQEAKAYLKFLADRRAAVASGYAKDWAFILDGMNNKALEALRAAAASGDPATLAADITDVLRKHATFLSEEQLFDARVALYRAASIQIRAEVALSGKATTYINWREIDRQIARWSTKNVGELITQVGEGSIEKVQKYVAQFLSDENMPFKDLEKKIAAEFGEERAARIANTELTRAASGGVDEFVAHARGQGFRVDTVWHTDQGENSCEECLALDGERNTGETPPLHPNCACTLGIDWVGFEDEADEYVTGMELALPPPLVVESKFIEKTKEIEGRIGQLESAVFRTA